ncbi:MAG: endonuclease III [Chloroflexi bacterium]|nr:endonuclease III [Chloroflexota bacterium]
MTRPGTGAPGLTAAVRRTPAATSRRPPARRKRAKPDPVKAWVRRLARYRPNLQQDVRAGLSSFYGTPTWERRLDPTSELILTILTQNSADINAEKAFEALRRAYPGTGLVVEHHLGAGWGGEGLPPGAAPDWAAVEFAPIDELTDVIRPGGLANQKAPRLQSALRTIREARGDYSLEFLGELPATDARAWLTQIDGIGKKTASIVLLFCFGLPLMPVDRHVERVAKRIGLIPPKATADDAHELFLAMLEPDEMYEAHVNLIQHGRRICHARNPEHERCPVAARCRFVNPKAP